MDAWRPKYVEDYDTIKCLWKWKCINLYKTEPPPQSANWGRRLALRASRRPSVYVAIPALTALLGFLTDT
jgi:hypothetical protein